jgi:hypothetical protein
MKVYIIYIYISSHFFKYSIVTYTTKMGHALLYSCSFCSINIMYLILKKLYLFKEVCPESYTAKNVCLQAILLMDLS